MTAAGPSPAQPRGADARPPAGSSTVMIEVEQALGPGVEYERDRGAGLVGRRARPGGPWFGFDRAALVDSDDGTGRRLPVLVALPASTFAGARLEVELTGGWSSAAGCVLVARLPGGPTPVPALARLAGAIGDPAAWLDREAAELDARHARQRDRERRSHARIREGRAWDPAGVLPPEIARFATPHSVAEYRLTRLPPRFRRGLDGLLDDDERLLYWVDRPAVTDAGVVRRLRGRVDRRAALLALTDRQLLWIVDHAQPDRYLSDWGVDVELLPVERVLEVACTRRDSRVELAVVTAAGMLTYALPAELEREAGVMRDLIARFTPDVAGRLPRRRYPLAAAQFDPEPAARFGQAGEALALLEDARRVVEPLAFLYSPRRPGQRRPAAAALTPTTATLLGASGPALVELAAVPAISLTLSPLIGRLSFQSGLEIAYPAPLAEQGAALVRLARRALANLG